MLFGLHLILRLCIDVSIKRVFLVDICSARNPLRLWFALSKLKTHTHTKKCIRRWNVVFGFQMSLIQDLISVCMFMVLVTKSSHTDTCRYRETEDWKRTKICLIRSASNAKEIWVNYLNMSYLDQHLMQREYELII